MIITFCNAVVLCRCLVYDGVPIVSCINQSVKERLRNCLSLWGNSQTRTLARQQEETKVDRVGKITTSFFLLRSPFTCSSPPLISTRRVTHGTLFSVLSRKPATSIVFGPCVRLSQHPLPLPVKTKLSFATTRLFLHAFSIEQRSSTAHYLLHPAL